MRLLALFILTILKIHLTNECALPYWMTAQYQFPQDYQSIGQPKTTFRYRETFRKTDPNNFVRVTEYSQFTWWEHDTASSKLTPEDIKRITNNIFTKPNGLDFVKTMLPKNNGVKGIFHEKDNTNGMIPENSPDVFRKSGDTNENDDLELGNESKVTDTVMTPDDTSTTVNSFLETDTTIVDPIETTIFEEATSTTAEVPPTIASERERNENEDVEFSNDLESGNDLDTADTLSQLKDKKTGNASKGRFLSGWFGTKTENETEPCKVTETNIHSLRSMIEKMFNAPREHVFNPETKEKAREDILNKFRTYGLQVWTQNFTTPLMENGNDTAETNEGVNLIGVIPGSQRGRLDDEIVLVGAHYDTVAESNGVDDNGSGLAVMLEVARAITEARCRLNHTLMFVAFDHEENGAMGSNYFVDNYLIPEELKRARARFQGAFILDGIMNFNDVPNTQELPVDYAQSLPDFQFFINNTGNRGNFLAMISRNKMDNHLSTRLMDAWQELGDQKYKLFNLAVDMGNTVPEPSTIQKHLNFLKSDHATFWYHNSSTHFPESLNAVLLTDTGPFRGKMKECYHSKCDDLTVITPEKLQFAKKTADALTATLVDLTKATSGVGEPQHQRLFYLTCILHIIIMSYIGNIRLA